ncbi:MAG: thymidylate kinase [Clostridia bacterium]|nr:thymidylate kinase [Clostridia bacterium]
MGKIITIDGLDGSGKTTQSERLYEELLAQGKNVKLISFPDYKSPSSALVRMYLGGEFGKDPEVVNAYAASTFYAVDRYASFMRDWKEFYEQPDAVVIATRYTTSNAVHQLAKIDREKWDEFLSWLSDFEYCKLGIPKPDLVLYLEMKPEITEELTRKRLEETGQKLDIHEINTDYITKSYKAALYASDKLGWKRICCYDGKEPLSPAEIEALIAEQVVMLLDVIK